MIAAVVFDFDGVLANSEPLHLQAYQEIFEALGVSLTPEDYYANYLGYDDEEVCRRLSARLGKKLGDREIEALLREKARVFDAAIEGTDVIFPAAVECVKQLAADYPLGIASGALRHEIQTILRRASLDRYFRFIVAAGDTASSKPSPAPYARAARLHGVRPASCVAIEDSHWGIESAKNAGLKCVGITTSYPGSQLGNADRVIDSLGEFTPSLIRSL